MTYCVCDFCWEGQEIKQKYKVCFFFSGRYEILVNGKKNLSFTLFPSINLVMSESDNIRQGS